MNGTLFAPLAVTLIMLATEGVLLMALAPRKDRAVLALAVLATLPMCAVAFWVVRTPLDHAIDRAMVGHYDAYRFVQTFYAPCTEEPAKLWPLALPFVRRRIVRENAVFIGAALGLGFGIGEAWFLGHLLLRGPEIDALPWHALSGFVIERSMVAVIHGAATAMAVSAVPWGFCRFVAGFAFAALFHYATNFPIYLARLVPDLKPLVGLWVLLCFAFGVAVLVVLAKRARAADS